MRVYMCYWNIQDNRKSRQCEVAQCPLQGLWVYYGADYSSANDFSSNTANFPSGSAAEEMPLNATPGHLGRLLRRQ
jgi:phage terminase large subunit-like protein